MLGEICGKLCKFLSYLLFGKIKPAYAVYFRLRYKRLENHNSFYILILEKLVTYGYPSQHS